MLHQHTRLTTCKSPDARKEYKYNLTKPKYIDTVTEYQTNILSQILLQSIIQVTTSKNTVI